MQKSPNRIGTVTIVLLFTILAMTWSAPDALGQQKQFFGQQQNKLNGGEKDSLKISGRFHLEKGKRVGYLILKAEIPAGNYIYSLNQKGDIPPTKIKVTPSRDFKVGKKFEADRTAEVIAKDPIYGTRVEKHKKLVQFFIPIELNSGVDPQKVKPQMVFESQVCSDAGFCVPIRDKKVSAKFGGYFSKQAQKKSENAIKR